ncbi:pyrroline-5-carboxylate reductase family protein [Aspergillus stella-maris]|uniref:pyrroline-5-carboxylate reductase family protein n=1 Tax=Aspergillus stella-maris TaxID=1810926 RepID=UPI003CCD226B
MTPPAPMHLTFIGGGHLAQAILNGILTSSTPWIQQCSIAITARRPERAQTLKTEFPQPSLLVSSDNVDSRIWDATRTAEHSILFICTRPADIPPPTKQLAPILGSFAPRDRPTVVTMCPEITVAQLQGWLPPDTAIVRTMPNTPVEERQGAKGLFAAGLDDELGRARVQHVKSVLESVSPVVTIVKEEELLDVVAAVLGSGPAHFFQVTESMVVAAEAMGLDRETAEPLVIQSCLGAGFLARASSKSVSELREEVCVPGGSTEKAIEYLRENGLGEMFREAMERSLDANREMRIFGV